MHTVALTIAGSDPSGGAGLQADLKTFQQHGVYGMSVVTLLTVQNTQHVTDVRVLDAAFVAAQLDAVLADIPPVAAKTGALGSADVIALLADRAADFGFPVVVDPVMISKHGDSLIDDAAKDVLRRRLVPRAFLVTPNRHEAAELARFPVESLADMERAAVAISLLGVPHVLVKGGRDGADSVNVLCTDGEVHHFRAPRTDTPHTHGSGCVFSAAITAQLARGEHLLDAVQAAKCFVTEAIRTQPGLGAPGGHGPLNLFAAPND